MQTKFLQIILLTTVIAAGSCNKLVQVPDNAGGNVVTTQVFTDSIGATAGILGLYTSPALTLQFPETNTGLSGDELFTTSTQQSLLVFYKDSLSPGSLTSSPPTGAMWSSYYGNSAIYLANTALEALATDSILTPAVRNQLMGECKVVRALCYFYLVNLFGDVPLVTSSSYLNNQNLPRMRADSVYAQITRDLLDGQTLLTARYPSAGHLRSNRYTATTLLARVYLYTKQWSAAEAMADTVINSGLYSLESNLDKIFLHGSKEAILQLGSNFPSYPTVAPGFAPLLPILSFLPPTYALTPSLTKAFEPGDLRRAHWIGTSTVSTSTGPTTYSYAYKYKNNTSSTNGITEDLMVFRLAELYLIRAEARARQGNIAGAMQDVNTIRTRAGLTTPITASSPDEAVGFVLHERQVELFAEWGHRWLDMKRMDSVNAIMTRTKPQYWPADGHSALYPIPQTEILYNQYLIQNPGY
jgi:hypothetical protein